jgi:hypothetical protein
VRNRVPIKNELVVQLIRSNGMRRSTLTSQDDVLLSPGMHFGAVGAVKLVRFDFLVRPKLFLDRLTGGREFGGGRASNENSFCHGRRNFGRED